MRLGRRAPPPVMVMVPGGSLASPPLWWRFAPSVVAPRPPVVAAPLVALICLMVGGSRLAPLWSQAPGGADLLDGGWFAPRPLCGRASPPLWPWALVALILLSLACFGLVFGVGGWLGALVALIWLIWALVGAFGGPFWAQFCPKSPIVSVIWGLLFLTAGGATQSDPSHMGGVRCPTPPA